MNSFRILPMHTALSHQKEGGVPVQSLNKTMETVAPEENAWLGAYTHFTNDDNGLQVDHPLACFSAAIKANIAGRNWPTHCGSNLLKNYCSAFDSTVVSRLRQAGGRFMGITTMDEFGMGSSCEYTNIGAVVNPWDKSRTAGGSSGGSAAAVAAGLAWYGLGSDTGGSVRLPAHFCGIVGLKPTWGRISRSGLVAFASSLDTIGILGRDIQDVYLVFQTLAGYDPHDSTSLNVPVDQAPLTQSDNLKGIRIGIPRELASMEISDDVRHDYQESLRRLEGLGADLMQVELGQILDAVPVYTVLNCAESASNLHRFDGSLYGTRIEESSYLDTLEATRTAGFGSEVKRRLLLGAHVLSGGYKERYYLRACRARIEIKALFADLFTRVDILAMPTAPTSAFPLGSFKDDPVRMHLTDVLTVPASLAGLPALTFPTTLDRQGLPLSLQLVGAHCSERLLMESALVLEKETGFRQLKEAPWQKRP